MSQYYIGMMSGTSLDGIDAVLVDFAHHPLSLVAHHYQPYSPAMRDKIQKLCQDDALISDMMQLDAELGELYAEVASGLLAKAQVSAAQVIAIGNHGQTIAHQPDAPFPTTLQLGDASRIAQATGISTVCDFRRRDMAAGGQGAPLVPAFHQFLFRSDHHERIILNIGGIANITLLPSDQAKAVSGFDTGPGNTLLDHWCQRHTGKTIDEGGNWARSGKVLEPVLERLLLDEYFLKTAPKSTGTDYFNLSWLDNYLEKEHYREEDIQATLVQLTARTIEEAIYRFQPDSEQVMVCGGGSRNDFLMEELKRLLPNLEVTTTLELGYNPDFIEAMAFAWLARQTMENRPGNLPAVTGAHEPVILGAIHPAKRN